jgi:hypothetical protein
VEVAEQYNNSKKDKNMITYLKSEISIIKIDSETKEVLAIWDEGGLSRASVETLDENKYILITIVKVQEGFFTEATEEEFTIRKEIVKSNLVKLGF